MDEMRGDFRLTRIGTSGEAVLKAEISRLTGVLPRFLDKKRGGD